MKKTLSILFAEIIFASFSLHAQVNLKPVDIKESVKFQIKNFGLTVDGTLEGLEGAIIWDEVVVENSAFEVTVSVNSVNTGIALRDKHLRKQDYLDATTYPLIHFKSTRVSFTNESGVYEIEGKLTIKKTTKTISFPFKVSSKSGSPVFTGQVTINRRDFGIGSSSLSLANTVLISLNIQTMKSNGSD